MRRIIVVLFAIAAAVAAFGIVNTAGGQDLNPGPPATPNPGTGPTTIPKETYWERGGCKALVKKGKFRRAVAKTYAYEVGGVGGNYIARAEVTGEMRHRLFRKARCAPNHKITEHRRHKIAEEREVWKFHRKIDRMTNDGYRGEFSIPYSIVACESGTSGWYSAVNTDNPDRPAGAYQIITSTWHGYGGGAYAPTADAAPPWAQHIVALRIYAGGSGRGQWAC